MKMNKVIGLIILIIIIISLALALSRSENMTQKLEVYDFQANAPGKFLCLIGGTHGNEPAGMLALREIVGELQRDPTLLKNGRIRIIPAVNQWGLERNIRYNHDYTGIMPRSDINRNYTSEGGTDYISREIIDLIKGADLVIDFHEGWGYHICQPSSVGSTLSPSDYGMAPIIARKAVDAINSSSVSASNCKKFMVLPNESCKIGTTLACHMQKNHLPYILVETTGQNDIQPKQVRIDQAKIVARTAFSILSLCDGTS
jgi:predicted deacylase